MRIFRQLLAICLAFAVIAYCQGNSFDKIRYNGGTVQTNVKPDDWDNHLTVTSEAIRLQLKDGQVLTIDPRRVKGLSYGQEAHRRVGTMIGLAILLGPLALFGLFHKTRLHFVGIEYTTEEGKPAGLLLQAHKENYRAVLMALRGATGAPVAVAEEDRKYVPTGVEVVVSKSEEAEKEGDPTKTAKAGVVQVTSKPESAEVWVDGNFVGNTPAKLNLVPGKHKVKVSLQGYVDWEREIEVLSESDVGLTAVLEKK